LETHTKNSKGVNLMATTAQQREQAKREREWRTEEDVRALKRAAEIEADATRRNAAQKALQKEVSSVQKALAGVKPKAATSKGTTAKSTASKRKPKTR
jgi:hypothetical protein